MNDDDALTNYTSDDPTYRIYETIHEEEGNDVIPPELSQPLLMGCYLDAGSAVGDLIPGTRRFDAYIGTQLSTDSCI